MAPRRKKVIFVGPLTSSLGSLWHAPPIAELLKLKRVTRLVVTRYINEGKTHEGIMRPTRTLFLAWVSEYSIGATNQKGGSCHPQ